MHQLPPACLALSLGLWLDHDRRALGLVLGHAAEDLICGLVELLVIQVRSNIRPRVNNHDSNRLLLYDISEFITKPLFVELIPRGRPR